MKREISNKSIAVLERDGGRISDSLIAGFVAERLPSGRVRFGYRFGSNGNRGWITIGLLGELTPAEARAKAERYRGAVRDGRDPANERKMKAARAVNTVDAVLDGYIKAHIEKLRSGKAVIAALANHVRPVLGKRVIYDLKRSDIVKLHETIRDKYPRAADRVLSYINTALAWHEKRDDDFTAPKVKGTHDGKARDRALALDEIADVWRALDEIEGVSAAFPALVKVLLLTGCRYSEVAGMHTDELELGNAHVMMGGVGTKKAAAWTIPAARTKNKMAHMLPLIPAIKKLLPECKAGYVFSVNGKDPISRGYHPKVELDAAIAKIRRRDGRPAMKPWVLHDLRRTARTLMAKVGVSEDISERVLNHKKKGIVAVYNRHEYFVEKADALTRLAAEIERIVKPVPTVAKLRLVAR